MEFLVYMEVGAIGDAEAAATLIRKEAERSRELGREKQLAPNQNSLSS